MNASREFGGGRGKRTLAMLFEVVCGQVSPFAMYLLCDVKQSSEFRVFLGANCCGRARYEGMEGDWLA